MRIVIVEKENKNEHERRGLKGQFKTKKKEKWSQLGKEHCFLIIFNYLGVINYIEFSWLILILIPFICNPSIAWQYKSTKS